MPQNKYLVVLVNQIVYLYQAAVIFLLMLIPSELRNGTSVQIRAQLFCILIEVVLVYLLI